MSPRRRVVELPKPVRVLRLPRYWLALARHRATTGHTRQRDPRPGRGFLNEAQSRSITEDIAEMFLDARFGITLPCGCTRRPGRRKVSTYLFGCPLHCPVPFPDEEENA